MRRSGRTWAAAMATAALAALAAVTALPAGAAHWSQLGGDPGRSGAQAVDQGGVPAEFLYSRTGLADRDVRTSVVTSAGGPPSVQRLAYGTEDGVLLLRVLLSGAAVGPAGGTDLSAHPFPFGSVGSVSLVESSTADALGQVLAVHNELYEGNIVGVELAEIDETTGERVRADVAITGTIGYRIESSPLLTAPDGLGNRRLFFVASDGTNERLFQVVLAAGGAVSAVTSTADVNANEIASPTLVTLADAGGALTPYVAVGTTDGLRTFAVGSLAAGPVGPGVGGPLRTPSVPAVPAAGTGAGAGSVIFAASGGSDATVLHRFTQDGSAQVLARLASASVAGEAAPALALTTDGTRAIVTTSVNVYAFRTTDLALAAKLSPTDDVSPGFRKTTAATTGDVVFVVSDGGRQFALEQATLQAVDGDLFTPAPASAASVASFGQPSISHRFLQVTTDRGLFVYGLRRATPPTGYWLAASDGGIFSYGDAGFFGSTGDVRLNKPIVTMAPTSSEEGYWLAATDGGIFAFGDAGFFGSTGAIPLNSPIVGMVPTRTGLGYWLAAADGGVFAFGDATFLGSMGDVRLNRPIVGMAASATGEGYFLVASDGGIFAFGDAEFAGSTGDIRLNSPIVGMARVPAGGGYWLVAADGGIFAFGRRAGFFGSTGDLRLNSPIVALSASATGQGYVFTAADGGVFVFGDAPFLGAPAELGRLNRPVVTVAAKP